MVNRMKEKKQEAKKEKNIQHKFELEVDEGKGIGIIGRIENGKIVMFQKFWNPRSDAMLLRKTLEKAKQGTKITIIIEEKGDE